MTDLHRFSKRPAAAQFGIHHFVGSLLTSGRAPRHRRMEIVGLAGDRRFVVMGYPDWSTDWQRGVLTGADYCTIAEEFITKRISGEIDRSVFFLARDEDIDTFQDKRITTIFPSLLHMPHVDWALWWKTPQLEKRLRNGLEVDRKRISGTRL
ncbi:hypothetical protein C8R43DRAFT_957602 [Mycena crocata]|nr:hypothetical protein C8R43DRAFT_957602 [Mycena crocata]